MTTSLFISKEVSNLFTNFCSQKHIDVIATSLLQFHLLPNKYVGDYDVVFFASPRAVDFFLKNHVIPSNKIIAAAGQGTANHLVSKGYYVDFTPTHSGRVDKSAKDFANWVGDRNVLFPISTISNQSYTQYLPSNQIATVVVYETLEIDQLIAQKDIYVFTSPSSVRAFLKLNEIAIDAKIISWGESTSKELLKHLLNQDIITLDESSEECLMKVLSKLF